MKEEEAADVRFVFAVNTEEIQTDSTQTRAHELISLNYTPELRKMSRANQLI